MAKVFYFKCDYGLSWCILSYSAVFLIVVDIIHIWRITAACLFLFFVITNFCHIRHFRPWKRTHNYCICMTIHIMYCSYNKLLLFIILSFIFYYFCFAVLLLWRVNVLMQYARGLTTQSASHVQVAYAAVQNIVRDARRLACTGKNVSETIVRFVHFFS